MNSKCASVTTESSSFMGMIRPLLVSLFLVSSCPALAIGTLEKVAQTGILTIGYQLAPPFSYLNQNQPIGYSIDLCMKVVDAIKRETKRPDLTIKFTKVTLESRVPTLIKGEIDLECANTSNAAELRKTVAFTIPTYFSTTRMMVREGSGINSIFDLANKTVNTTRGSRGERIFNEANASRTLSAKNLVTDDFDGSFSVMETDKADAFILDDVLLYTMRAASKSKTMYVLTPASLSVEPLSLMLRKDDPTFKKLVDDEVTRIILNGEINSIYRKWFESPIPPQQYNLKLPMSFMLRDSFKTPSDWVPN